MLDMITIYKENEKETLIDFMNGILNDSCKDFLKNNWEEVLNKEIIPMFDDLPQNKWKNILSDCLDKCLYDDITIIKDITILNSTNSSSEYTLGVCVYLAINEINMCYNALNDYITNQGLDSKFTIKEKFELANNLSETLANDYDYDIQDIVETAILEKDGENNE